MALACASEAVGKTSPKQISSQVAMFANSGMVARAPGERHHSSSDARIEITSTRKLAVVVRT